MAKPVSNVDPEKLLGDLFQVDKGLPCPEDTHPSPRLSKSSSLRLRFPEGNRPYQPSELFLCRYRGLGGVLTALRLLRAVQCVNPAIPSYWHRKTSRMLKDATIETKIFTGRISGLADSELSGQY